MPGVLQAPLERRRGQPLGALGLFREVGVGLFGTRDQSLALGVGQLLGGWLGSLRSRGLSLSLNVSERIGYVAVVEVCPEQVIACRLQPASIPLVEPLPPAVGDFSDGLGPAFSVLELPLPFVQEDLGQGVERDPDA